MSFHCNISKSRQYVCNLDITGDILAVAITIHVRF